MEGALSGDMVGLVQLVERSYYLPAVVVLQTDYRMFAGTHDATARISRPWLTCHAAPLVSESAKFLEARTDSVRPADRLVLQTLQESSLYLLLRAGRQLGAQYLLPRLSPVSLEKQGDDEAMLRLKLRSFYCHHDEIVRSKAYADLTSLVRHLLELHVPVLICFTPTNFGFLGRQVNRPVHAANTAALEQAILKDFGSDSLFAFLNLQGRVEEAMFLDHCHMTEAGNKKVAEIISDNILILCKKSGMNFK